MVNFQSPRWSLNMNYVPFHLMYTLYHRAKSLSSLFFVNSFFFSVGLDEGINPSSSCSVLFRIQHTLLRIQRTFLQLLLFVFSFCVFPSCSFPFRLFSFYTLYIPHRTCYSLWLLFHL